jgi:hypothetical protein
MPIKRADDESYVLLSNGSATGNSVAIRGGEYMVYFDGTIGGATISLQMQSPSGAWADIEVFTANAIRYTALPRSQTGIYLPAGNVRCALTGGTPSAINAHLIGLG